MSVSLKIGNRMYEFENQAAATDANKLFDKATTQLEFEDMLWDNGIDFYYDLEDFFDLGD